LAKSRIPGRFGGFLGFIGVSAAAGVLATAAITPAIAVTSMAASDTIGLFEDLPDYLEIGALSQRTNIYANNPDGSPYLLATFYDQNRVEVPWEAVSGYALDAAIAGEDPRFYEHGGIDLQGTVRALINNALGKSIQGGSSITQQYVKNVNIQNAIKDATTQEEITAAFEKATETSEARKLREMKLAIGLEKAYTKDEILLGYMNIVHMGGRVYGVEAASNYYFGTTAANLTLPQAASLMAVVNNPEKFRLDYPDSETNGVANGYLANKQRRDYIIGKMLEEKMISQQEHDDAVAAPVEPVITNPSVGCQAARGAGFFCDYVVRVFKNDEFFGSSETERMHRLVTSGYDVYTTLDMELQGAAEAAINENVPATLPDFDVGSSVVTVQPGTGKILAMAQNKTYSDDPAVLEADPAYSAVNYNADYTYGGSTGFQPGSTYKMFTLIEWLKEGHGLNEGVDARLRDWTGTSWRDSCAGGTVRSGKWDPRNDERDNPGFMTAMAATETSKNSAFAAMAKQLDLCGIRNTAASMGVYRADKGAMVYDPATDQNTAVGTGELQKSPATILGTNEVAPLQMAGAFATVAAGGLYCEPRAIDRIVAPDGSDVEVPPITCTQVLEPDIAAAAAYALQNAFQAGTGGPSYNTYRNLGGRAPIFGKTGTTDEAVATWMTGSTTKATTVAGVFNVVGSVNQRKYGGFDSGPVQTARHRIFPRVMAVAAAKWGGDAFPQPTAQLLRGQTVDVPNVAGLSLADARRVIEGAGLGFADGGQQDSGLPVGQVTGTSPSGSVNKGTIVTVYTSNGALRTVPDAVTGKASFDQARAALNGAGFANVAESCQVDPAGTGAPSAQDPPPGTAARADTTITITTRKPAC
jgi:membrane peptidoglycan carboxypeptidase